MTLTATCGRCKQYHSTIEEARNCYLRIAQTIYTPPVKTFEPATARQLSYINDLGGSRAKAVRMSKSEASDYITVLKRRPRPVNLQTTAPNRVTTKVPISMLYDAIKPGREGRFAVQADTNTPYVFFRITTPKSGQFAGSLKVQTQHGPDFKLALVVWPGVEQRVTVYNKSVEDDLLLVCVDPNGGKIAYGRELHHCGICGKELTDERSRWYGIGPDCETRNGHIIDLVNDSVGPYRPGRA